MGDGWNATILSIARSSSHGNSSMCNYRFVRSLTLDCTMKSARRSIRIALPMRIALVFASIGLAGEAPADIHASFKPGQVWSDTAGNAIQSHLGGVMYENGTYYWYGMNFNGTTLAPGTLGSTQYFSWMLNQTVSCYSSTDLYNWKSEGVSLAHDGVFPSDNMLIRPKVIKNDVTGKYVMMAALTSPDFATTNNIIVATGDTATGPFTVSKVFTPPGGAYDMGLYKDDNGKAYLITAHDWVKISELSDDYLSIKTTTTVSGASGEAPAIFKSNGTYYFVGSQLTGWAPNANHYSTASSILGPWTYKGEFATGTGAGDTFASQTTFVLPVAGREDSFIFMADRTNATSSSTIADLGAMTHVWLPITLDQDSQTMSVAWRDQWDLSAFPAATPEPSSLILSFTALVAVVGYARSKRNRLLESK
jgi:hypothetical protein